MNCWMSYSVTGSLARMRRAISANASMMMRCVLSEASMCDCFCAGVQTASNCWTSSALVTGSPPQERTSSIVPASTRDMYGMSFMGEYCMAMRDDLWSDLWSDLSLTDAG